VKTTGLPHVVNGKSTDAMSPEKFGMNLPCINVFGVVDMGFATV
jgi:hypothetical protein